MNSYKCNIDVTVYDNQDFMSIEMHIRIKHTKIMTIYQLVFLFVLQY